MTAAVSPISRPALLRFLPPTAVGIFALIVGAVVWASGETFGFDFLAYYQAAERVLAGERLYDPTVEQTGGFGLFYYPPPFVLPILPLALLNGSLATWVWLAISIAAFFAAVALMPVSVTVRWTIVLLAGAMWPVAYTFKLGQVGPLLLLAFAVGWRWMDRPGRLGTAASMGALIKLQPGLILVWAALTGRWTAVLVGGAIAATAAIAATLVVGINAWFDYVALLRNVSDPITTPHNFTPGAIAFQMGTGTATAALIQLAASIAVVGAVIIAAWRAAASASFLVGVMASQLLSPVLWDHYAMLLLLPVAWLLQRQHRWAVLVPLALSIPLVSVLPPAVYPLSFGLLLGGVLLVGVRDRRTDLASDALVRRGAPPGAVAAR